MELTYYSDVKEGKLQNNVRQKIAQELPHFNEKRVEIIIRKLTKKRSQQQNKYIHLLFTIFKTSLNDLGNDFTMEEVKEICKYKFGLTDVLNKQTGEVIGQRIKGTHEMSKTEMIEFIESVIRYAAECFDIILPYPSEQIKAIF